MKTPGARSQQPGASPSPLASRPSPRGHQLDFDWLLGAKQFFTLKQAGDILGMSEDFAERLFDQGVLSGHEHNAAGGERMTKRVARAFLAAYLASSARYDAPQRLQALVSCLPQLAGADLLALAAECRRAAAAKGVAA